VVEAPLVIANDVASVDNDDALSVVDGTTVDIPTLMGVTKTVVDDVDEEPAGVDVDPVVDCSEYETEKDNV